ncbi:alkaline phosphatase-like protein [Rhizopus microsporus var. microsporus]|uniref:Alkaline phosphatase n=2 Tax=Rhizopus microsporus TaxID=58291 RepID=A0A2G4T866_RHIZD|nr:alkaline phosphatase [Rhizopus microsporus ATCC 52813]ORE09244.1 alkaline phosphatase-like protein [Rhizopus microsporus var. microsporus]PHZ17177.1 alkaline phosphatase [Rhizopus microsporus ATCC 52813]
MSKANYSTITVDPEGASEPREENRKRFHIIVGSIILAFIASVIIGFFILLGKNNADPPRNVIMMISDGFGPASETYARQYSTWLNKRDVKSMLPLDEIHVGHSRTQSSSSLVTDSAAGATAFACAHKSYNGAIGVFPDKKPCATVLESAKIHKDMLTGLVVTSRITHATPASFSAHVAWRDWENLIAEQQIGHTPLGRTVDLMFGGGICEFLSNATEGSCRADDRDLFKEAQDTFGWNVKYGSRKHLDHLKEDDVELPIMALFAPHHMDYEIDRKHDEQPALHEMVAKALAILEKKSKEQNRGFFLMIEGSRIDMAAHTNDPAAHVHDILEYQRTVQLVKDFVEEHPNTVMVSTSDHETGGFTAGRQVGEDYPEYKWNPEVIQRVQNSSEALANAWESFIKTESNVQVIDHFLRHVIIKDGLGIDDATEEEVDKIKAWEKSGKTAEQLAYLFGDMVSRRALIGWTTHGHTAVDVNLYAKGDGTEVLRGSHENTDIGDFIIDYLGLDLEPLTDKLKDLPVSDELLSMQMENRVTSYHG